MIYVLSIYSYEKQTNETKSKKSKKTLSNLKNNNCQQSIVPITDKIQLFHQICESFSSVFNSLLFSYGFEQMIKNWEKSQ